MVYMSNFQVRLFVLYWCKVILFQKVCVFYIMIKVEVIIVIDYNGQCFVGGFLGFLEIYNKGIFKFI